MKFVKTIGIALGTLMIISCSDTKNEISKKRIRECCEFYVRELQ